MKSDDIILITGKIRSGKSTWLRNHLRTLERSKIPYIIWDYNFEHIRQSICKNLETLKYYFPSRPFISYHPPQKTFEHFNQFVEVCLTFYNYVLVVEEIDRFANQYMIPPALKNLIDTGSHHQGIGLICTTRRIKRLHADIPFNASYIVVFKQHRPQDLSYLAEYCGDQIFSIKTLPDYSYMVFDDTRGETTAYEPL